MTFGLVARHILMTGAQADTSLVNVLWSLVIELRISLIFPALYFLVKGRTKSAFVAAIAMQFLFRYLTKQSGNFVPFFNKNWTEAFENIGYYIPFFIAGIVARENIDAIKRFVARLHKVFRFPHPARRAQAGRVRRRYADRAGRFSDYLYLRQRALYQ